MIGCRITENQQEGVKHSAMYTVSAGAAGEAFMAGASRGRFQECQILRNIHHNVVSVASGWCGVAVS